MSCRSVHTGRSPRSGWPARTTILLWVASLLKLNVPPEVASALTLFIATGAGYTLRADDSASSRAPSSRAKAPSRSAAMATAG